MLFVPTLDFFSRRQVSIKDLQVEINEKDPLLDTAGAQWVYLFRTWADSRLVVFLHGKLLF